MTSIKAITLHMENLDDFTIYEDNVAEFYLGDFNKYYSRQALNWIGEVEVANKFHIHIHKEANTNENRNVNYNEELPFERISKYGDITQIELKYEDGTSKSYCISWTGEDDYNNECQQSLISATGDLYIVIGEDLTIEDTFDFDDESVEFYWEMIKA